MERTEERAGMGELAEAEEALESETVDREGTKVCWLHTWRSKTGWYYCFSGVNEQGLYSESEDCGPYPSREAAREAAHKEIEME